MSLPIEFNEVLNRIDDMDVFLVPYENAENYGIKALTDELTEDNKIASIKKIGILVGPEGGLEQSEIDELKDKGAYIITLGNRILRTETAGFTTTSLIQYELGDLGGIR